MKELMLSMKAFEASRQYIETTARPLERVRFHQEFDGSSSESVVKALREYQNNDGGFGRALEPDLRTQESSALCTTIALQMLRSARVKLGKEIVSGIIRYLLKTLNQQEWSWRPIPKSAEQSPHAPWWNQANRENAFDGFSLNPTAELLGYLYDYREQVPGDILSQLSEKVTNRLSGLEKIEMHDLLCCLRLFQTEYLPGDLWTLIARKLPSLIDSTVSKVPEQWKGYGLRPLQVVDSPESPFMTGLEGPVAANIDYEISSRNEDGSWTPTWTWGGAYPDAWLLAWREWTSVITLEKLLLLRKFRRIEGIM